MTTVTTSTWRGHLIEQHGEKWHYADTAQPVAENKDRACGYCQQRNTPEGHDACCGALPGVMNACCGHGQTRDAYVQLSDGTTIKGVDALTVIAILTRHQRSTS